MKIFGQISELVAAVFRKNSQAVTFRPNQATTYTASRDIQMPQGDADHVLVSRTSTDTLTNKTFTSPTLTAPTSTDGSFTSVDTFSLDDTDSANNLIIQSTSTLTANRTLTLDADDGNRTLELSGDLRNVGGNSLTLTTTGSTNVTLPTTGTLITTTGAATLTNKALVDNSTTIVDSGDNTKVFRVNVGGTSGTALTVTTAQGQDTQVAIPNLGADDTFAFLAAAQTLSTKTLDNSNSASFKDSTGFTLQDTADTTKQAKLDVPTAQTTGTTRTHTLPAVDSTLASLAGTETFTNKTLTSPTINTPTITAIDTAVTLQDSGDNTKQAKLDVPTAQTTGTTRTHTLPAVDSTLASLAGTETFTNKTLTTPTVNAPLFDGADNSRYTDYQENTGTPATPGAGILRLYSKTDNKLYTKDPSGTETLVGSGSGGELNLVENPSDANNWSETGAVFATPATTTTAGDLPLGGTVDTAIQFVATGSASESTTYNSYTMTPGEALKNRKHKVEFWMRPGTGFVSGEWTISVYNVAGPTRMALSTDSSGVTTLPSFTGKFTTTFDADTSTSYTVRFARTTGSGSATLNVAAIVVGPGIQPQGAVVGPTQTVTFTGSWITNTTYTAYERRDGEWAHYQVKALLAGAPTAATLTFTLPAGRTIDTSKLTNAVAATRGVIPGSKATISDNSASDYDGNVHYLSTTSVGVSYLDDAAAGVVLTAPVNATAPVTFAVNDFINIYFSVPISEWAGSGTSNVVQNEVEYAYNTSTADAADTTSFGYGPVGTDLPGTLTASRVKRVRFLTPIQVTDRLEMEISFDSGVTWRPTDSNNAGSYGYVIQNTTEYGVFLGATVGSTDVNVTFTRYSIPSGATYGAAGSNWTSSSSTIKWRLKKYTGGNAVGFGNVSQNSGGLVKSAGQLLGTNTNDSAASGFVGERLSINRLRSNLLTLTTNVASNVGTTTSITLTPGQWTISGAVGFQAAATTSVTNRRPYITATSATEPGSDTISVPNASGEFGSYQDIPATVATGDYVVVFPSYTVKVAAGATQTLYLIALATFTVSTLKAYGYLEAVRTR